MRLADIVNGPWAIIPGMLDEIQAVYAAHTRREKIDLKAIEASIGRPLENEQKPYEVNNGTAVIPIQGVIAKKMNMFTRISGGTSSELVKRDFQAALEDPEVQKILLYIDSPGGAVDGTFELADAIYQARGTKPVIAFTDGQMASAAYLIASAADKRYISSEATAVGSIGVISKHTDISKQQELEGVKTTVLTAGKYKGTGHPYGALSAEHQQTMQGELDYLYSAFVDTVSRNLGVSTEQCINDMAEGRVFLGKQAITAGLVDGVSTMDELMKQTDSNNYLQSNSKKMPGMAGAAKLEKGKSMNLAEMKLKHPEVFAAAFAAGQTDGGGGGPMCGTCSCGDCTGGECATCTMNPHKMSACAERERIQAIHGLPAAGHKDLVSAAMFDGKSTAGDLAMAIIKKEEAVRTGTLANLAADAPKPSAADESVDIDEDQTKNAAVVSSMVAFAKQSGRA